MHAYLSVYQDRHESTAERGVLDTQLLYGTGAVTRIRKHPIGWNIVLEYISAGHERHVLDILPTKYGTGIVPKYPKPHLTAGKSGPSQGRSRAMLQVLEYIQYNHSKCRITHPHKVTHC